jgi:DNA-binding NtrC family response regulator
MKKLLVIEDDEKMREGLVEILMNEGYAVKSAENGQLGLDIIKDDNINLVLTDIMMPVMGGMEVLLEIKRIKPNTQVILITAFASIDNAVEAMKAGASDYITKPFKIGEVQTKIRKTLALSELEKYPEFLESDILKGISNPIRKNVVKLLEKEGKLKFTQIKNMLKIEDATKLSFHLRVLRSHNVIEQDNEKIYMLTREGIKLIENLKRIEKRL